MRRVLIRRAGGYERLEVVEEPDPAPGPGEVAIDVAAAGVNYADCVVRMGLYASAKKYVGWPITPGFEVAGTVTALGAGASGGRDAAPHLAPGARVLAVTRFGGYASRVVVPAHQVFPPPERFSLAEAAGFPAVFLTAWYALLELGRPRPGARVLVHSAAGGVGGALLQLARIAGCRAVGVVGGPHKVEAAWRAGAEAVIDKSREDLWAAAERLAPEGFDVVLDANGPETLRQSYRHLAPTGRLVIYGFHSMLPRAGGRPSWLKLALGWLRTPRFDPLRMTNENRSVLAFNLSYLFERSDLLRDAMDDLLRKAGDGAIAAPPVTEYPLARVVDAHRAIESGTTVGKLVLTM